MLIFGDIHAETNECSWASARRVPVLACTLDSVNGYSRKHRGVVGGELGSLLRDDVVLFLWSLRRGR